MHVTTLPHVWLTNGPLPAVFDPAGLLTRANLSETLESITAQKTVFGPTNMVGWQAAGIGPCPPCLCYRLAQMSQRIQCVCQPACLCACTHLHVARVGTQSHQQPGCVNRNFGSAIQNAHLHSANRLL
jgi:hypothetical protein